MPEISSSTKQRLSAFFKAHPGLLCVQWRYKGRRGKSKVFGVATVGKDGLPVSKRRIDNVKHLPDYLASLLHEAMPRWEEGHGGQGRGVMTREMKLRLSHTSFVLEAVKCVVTA